MKWWQSALIWLFVFVVMIPVFYAFAAYDWLRERLRGEA
jgi:hypothetical protein